MGKQVVGVIAGSQGEESSGSTCKAVDGEEGGQRVVARHWLARRRPPRCPPGLAGRAPVAELEL